MSSNSSCDGARADSAFAGVMRALRVLAPASLALALLSVPGRAGVAATFPEMARLEAAERLDGIQVDRLARWYGTLGLSREASEFVGRRIRAGDLSRREAAPIFEAVVRDATRRGGDGLAAACDAALRNGGAGADVHLACADGLRAEGRLDSAAALLSRIAPGDVHYARARYSIGQVAVERGDLAAALGIFRDLGRSLAASRDNGALAARAVLAEETLVLLIARSRDPLRDAQKTRRTGGPSSGPPAPGSSANPTTVERVLEGIRAGDVAEGRGEIEEAVRAYRRSMEEAKAALSGPLPSESRVAVELEGPPEVFRLLLAAHEAAEELVVRNAAGASSASSQEVRDLLADVLCLGFVLARANDSLPPLPSSPGSGFLSPARRNALVRMMEKNALGGMEIGRLLAGSGEAVELLGNIAHPIRRYRNLVDLEGRQSAMAGLVARAGQSRDALIASLVSARDTELLALLRNLDAYLRDLDAVRSAWDEARDLIRRDFDIFSPGRTGDGYAGMADAAAREGLAAAGDATAELRRLARDLELRARSAARDHEERDLRSVHATAVRRYAEALVRLAQLMEETRPEGWQARFWTALGEGVAVLPEDAFEPALRAELAARIGTLAAARSPRWEQFPERAAPGPEDDLIRKLLPMLGTRPGHDEGDDRAPWAAALLRWRTGDPGAPAAAREYLARHPTSPMAGHVALRLGHDALRARRWREADAAYRAAARRGPADVAAAARFMLGWLAYRDGDADGALRELADPLSEPLAAGRDAGALEDDVVALAVRCGLGLPAGLVTAYGPIHDRTRVGKRILVGLAEAELRRGRMERAAGLFSAAARLYSNDGDDLAYEIRAVESLARGGMDKDALTAALALVGRRGGGAASPNARGAGFREQDGRALAGILRDVAERRFAEGMRSGRPEAMSDAAAGIREYFALAAPVSPAGEAELRLKLAIATLRGGDRASGLRLLDGILSGGASDGVAERAALLHSEEVVAGFAEREMPAAAVEASVRRLLLGFPGARAVALGMRAAAAFLDAGDFARAASAASAVEECGAATAGVRDEAGLLHARALLASGNFPAARAKADEVLVRAPETGQSGARAHARDVVLLATRKEARAKAAAGDRIAAAALLEGLAVRFSDLPDAAAHLLDALDHYRDASDGEGTIRTGTLFLRLFPGRVESIEVAATIGPVIEARGRGLEAANLYAGMSERFPRDEQARRFLFRAARLAEKEGDPEGARRWYSAYARRFAEPRWVKEYAVLSASLLALREDRSTRAIEAVETSLRHAEAAAGEHAMPELAERSEKARIAVGEYWAGRFREIPLVDPLEKSLARKQQCFRKSVAAYEEASRSTSLDVRLEASRASGDLFVEFGAAIMSSQRPSGMDDQERVLYESALAARSRKYVERALAGFSGTLDRLRQDGMPAGLAEPFVKRVETTTRLLAMQPGTGAR